MAQYKDTFILDDKVSAKLTKIVGRFNKFNEKLNKCTGNLQSLGTKGASALNKLGKSVSRIESGINKLGSTMVAVFGAQQLSRLSGSFMKVGMQFEDTLIDLETMLGSAQKADKMFKDIQHLAIKTPFETSDLLETTKQMLNFSIAEDKVLKYTRMLGDIAGGNKNRFTSLSLAFSQVASNKRLTGQDRLQMVTAGFNPIDELSKMTGKSSAQLEKEMSKGLISFEMVVKAMENATSKGGRFYKLMEKRSTTLSGKLSNLADAVGLWAGVTGLKVAKKLSPLVDKLIPKIEEKLDRLAPILINMPDFFINLAKKVGFEFNMLGLEFEAFTIKNKEFIDALKVGFKWLADVGLPELLKGVAKALQGLLKLADSIINIFNRIGSFIGKIIGWFITLPNNILNAFRDTATRIIQLLTPIIQMINQTINGLNQIKASPISQRIFGQTQQGTQTTNIRNTTNNNNNSRTFNINATGVDIASLIRQASLA